MWERLGWSDSDGSDSDRPADAWHLVSPAGKAPRGRRRLGRAAAFNDCRRSRFFTSQYPSHEIVSESRVSVRATSPCPGHESVFESRVSIRATTQYPSHESVSATSQHPSHESPPTSPWRPPRAPAGPGRAGEAARDGEPRAPALPPVPAAAEMGRLARRLRLADSDWTTQTGRLRLDEENMRTREGRRRAPSEAAPNLCRPVPSAGPVHNPAGRSGRPGADRPALIEQGGSRGWAACRPSRPSFLSRSSHPSRRGEGLMDGRRKSGREKERGKEGGREGAGPPARHPSSPAMPRSLARPRRGVARPGPARPGLRARIRRVL